MELPSDRGTHSQNPPTLIQAELQAVGRTTSIDV